MTHTKDIDLMRLECKTDRRADLPETNNGNLYALDCLMERDEFLQ